MTQEITPSHPAGVLSQALPPLPPAVLRAGEKTAWRFVDFFTASIRNPNTREAYYRAVTRFLDWCEDQGIDDLHQVRPIYVAAYVEHLQGSLSIPTVRQHLAAIRRCLDWLVSGGAIEANPASSVKGPSYVVRRGKTPVLDAVQTRELLDSIPLDQVVGQRDRALIAVMLYAFGRVGAVVAMNVEDYYISSRRRMVRLKEKGGKDHAVPAHHHAIEYVEDYLDAAGLWTSPKAPMFQSVRRGQLTGRRLDRNNALQMVKRRSAAAELPDTTGCHTFRATAITTYRQNGGSLENARVMAAHASSQTTRLYDHSDDAITLDEIERIRI